MRPPAVRQLLSVLTVTVLMLAAAAGTATADEPVVPLQVTAVTPAVTLTTLTPTWLDFTVTGSPPNEADHVMINQAPGCEMTVGPVKFTGCQRLPDNTSPYTERLRVQVTPIGNGTTSLNIGLIWLAPSGMEIAYGHVTVTVNVPSLSGYTEKPTVYCEPVNVGARASCIIKNEVTGPGAAVATPMVVRAWFQQYGSRTWVALPSRTIPSGKSGRFTTPALKGPATLKTTLIGKKTTTTLWWLETRVPMVLTGPRATTVGENFTLTVHTTTAFTGRCQVGTQKRRVVHGIAKFALYGSAPGPATAPVSCADEAHGWAETRVDWTMYIRG